MTLTEAQRQCLRLVYQHRSSKEIAHLLGIAKATVDQRIDAARAKLGGVSRIEAARLLAEHEGVRIPDPILYDPIPIPDPAAGALPTVSAGERKRRIPLPWPVEQGASNDLSFLERLMAIGIVALIGLLAVAILISAMNGLGGLVRG